MTRLESEFDQHFKHKGGRYDERYPDREYFSWILTNSRMAIAQMRRNITNLPVPYIDIVDNNEPNAYATKSGDRYFIGITSGTITLFNDIFFRLVSSKNISFFSELTDIEQLALTEEGPGKLFPVDA